MATNDIETRLRALELRLENIERRLSNPTPAPVKPAAAPSAAPSFPQVEKPPASPKAPQAEPRPTESSFATNLLGWGGAAALVLAAAYLIRLGIDSGWLTPTVQLGCAGLFGLVLIGAGFALRGSDQRYAGLLPAAGVAVLFLTVYGGHLYYHLIDTLDAGAAVIVVCGISLWLANLFESDLYALFAVVGSYSAPFLIKDFQGSFTDLAIYYSAWSLTFSVFSILGGRRLVYLIALYAALIGFDTLSRSGSVDWTAAIGFQAAQFAIFGATAAVFSISRESPMTTTVAALHLPPLLLFYALQYYILKTHLPAQAPWIAVASLGALLLLYMAARLALRRPLPGGELLLWAYAALVLFHAGYLENVPQEWAPWVVVLITVLVAVIGAWRRDGIATLWPLWIAGGLMFLINLLKIFFDLGVEMTPGRQALGFVYALLLYIGYGLTRDKGALRGVARALLYVGHLTVMVATLHALQNHILQSVVWGLLALACLSLSLVQRERVLGQSSLLVFGATAAKVLLYDLGGAPPLGRVIGLVVLGVTFYVGGMLYQRMQKAELQG